ncbi:MAG: radical SAM protein [Oscillospiraceae bacterium]|nr:radical SAM protein [Oscillospiraceae bacterium]
MAVCNICPRKCGVDRAKNNGYCGMSERVKISRAALHMWEEPCISADKGSGTVFFSGCNMKCVFCQNKDISHDGFGKEITVEHLADIMLRLQSEGALNINLVTPTHYTLQIIEAVKIARQKGLNLPIVCNTSGYENVRTVKLLKDTVDVWLPDFKYIDDEKAVRYSNAPGYTEIAKRALDEMVSQQGECVFDKDGVIQKGVIVRHLVMPGGVEDAKKITRYLYRRYGDKIYISLMSQYTPCTDLSLYPEIDRKVTAAEYDEVVDFAVDIGVENGFIQDGERASESFIPPFNLEGVD